MVTALLKALQAIATKLLAAVATQWLLEWALFKAAGLLVASTKTTHDDEFLEQVKKAYDKGDGK